MTPNLNEALATLLEIPISSRTSDVHIIIAAIATAVGNYDEADHALTALESSTSPHPETKIERARWLLEVGDLEASVEKCKTELKQTPTDSGLTAILIDGLFRLGLFKDALHVYDQFTGPLSIEMNVIAARAAMRTQNPKKATEILDGQLTMDTPMADAHYLRAQLAFLEHDTSRALTHLERACELAPTLNEAVNQLVHSYLELNRFDIAIPWIEQLIARNPNDPEQHFRLSIAFHGLSRFSDALSAIDTAIRLDPDSIELQCSRAGYLIRSGNITDGMTLLKEIVQKSNKNAIAFQTLGVAFQHQNRWEDSIKAFKKSLEIDGNDPTVYVAIATAYLALGDREMAKESFKSAALAGGGPELESIL